MDAPEELDLAALAEARVVGVTAGASAPEDLVQEIVAALAPTDGVEGVFVIEESEYFPPPRELREILPVLDAVVALGLGGDPAAAQAQGGPFREDRDAEASRVLANLRT